jgi:hypothetical protein
MRCSFVKLTYLRHIESVAVRAPCGHPPNESTLT